MHTEFFRAKHCQVLHYHRSEILRCKRRRLRAMETAVAVGPRPTCGGPVPARLSSAFAVASLYVGSIATAGVAGIRKAEDLVELGANLRTGLGSIETTSLSNYSCHSMYNVQFQLLVT
ncbi:unnamed protein product [Malus baccata var. baccata]